MRDVLERAIASREIPTQRPDLATALVFGVVLQPVTFAAYGRLPQPRLDVRASHRRIVGGRDHGRAQLRSVGEMSMRSPLVQLLTARRFAPLFVTQFLGALNDNLLKSALGILVTFRLAEQSGMNAATLAMVASALFIAPFFLFSGASGTLSDRFDKALIARWVKVAEIGIMALGAWGLWRGSVPVLLTTLFCLGTHSTVFGPIKYALLPQHLPEHELVAGNALIEAGTFLAILAGTIIGGSIALLGNGPLIVGALGVAAAVIGWLSARQIPTAPPSYTGEAPRIRLLRHRRRVTHVTQRPAPAANPRHLLVLALRVHRRLGIAGVCERRALRQRTGCHDDARALCDWRRCRIDPGGEAPARRGERTLRAMVGGGDGDLCDRSALGQRQRAGDGGTCRRHGVPRPTRQLAHRHRSDRHCHGRRPVHRAALRDPPARERAEPPVARDRGQQHHQRVVHDGCDRRRRPALPASDDGRSVCAGWLHDVSGGQYRRVVRRSLFKSVMRVLLRLLYRVEVDASNTPVPRCRTRSLLPITRRSSTACRAARPGEPICDRHVYCEEVVGEAVSGVVNAFPVDPTNPLSIRAMIRAVEAGSAHHFSGGSHYHDWRADEGLGRRDRRAHEGGAGDGAHRGRGVHALLELAGKVRRRWFPRVRIRILPPRRLTCPEGVTGRARRAALRRALRDEMVQSMFTTAPIETTLFDALLEARQQHGGSHPIADDIQFTPLSYRGLIAASFALGRVLAARTRPGERVGVLLPTSRAAVVTFFGLQAEGRVPAMLNFSTGRRPRSRRAQPRRSGWSSRRGSSSRRPSSSRW